MPCWYYDKKELRNTPSLRDGINSETEARYRREGARFIIDTGTKMGLRYDTCATGVVYFHRFYMFHSFREFHRYVMGACCLFLAGKVEETPKKCKDIVKTARTLLTDAQFMVFGDDPKEEVMTLERILLQTIKFDLQVEHPYAEILQFAKVLTGDKAKVQKLVQMAWTFINDSLCTTLCLQWESNIIAVALVYLASRLTKYEITEWEGKPPGYKGRWWEFYVSEVSLDLLEDVCHQVLDLYSATPQKKEESPPPPPPRPEPDTQGQSATQSQKAVKKNSPAQPTVKHRETAASPAKADRAVKRVASRSPSPKRARTKSGHIPAESQHIAAVQPKAKPHKEQIPTVVHKPYQQPPPAAHADTAPPGGQPKNMSYSSSYQQYQGGDGYSQYNPFVSQQMYSSSFMSQEGAQSIQSLIGVGSQSSSAGYSQQPPAQSSYNQQGSYSRSAQPYHQGSYQPPAAAQPAQTGYQPRTAAPPPAQQQYSVGYNQPQSYNTGTSYQQGYQQHQPRQPYAGQPSSAYPPYSHQAGAHPRHPMPAQAANGRGGPPPKGSGTPQPISRITSRR